MAEAWGALRPSEAGQPSGAIGMQRLFTGLLAGAAVLASGAGGAFAAPLAVHDVQPFDLPVAPVARATGPTGINNNKEMYGICFGGTCGAGYWDEVSGFAYIGQS